MKEPMLKIDMRFLLLFLFLTFNIDALEVSNHSLILVHTSRYYHQNEKTTESTNLLINQIQGDIIGLYQDEDKIHPLWYLPIESIDQFVYSIAGKHDISIKNTGPAQANHIYFSGGYFTHCLARAITSSMANHIHSSNNSQLMIHLPSDTIFTGHLAINNQLVPETAYDESILDETQNGINLAQVFDLLGKEKSIEYLRDAFPIVFINHSSMRGLDNYSIKVFYRGTEIIFFEKKNSVQTKLFNIYFD